MKQDRKQFQSDLIQKQAELAAKDEERKQEIEKAKE
jgi:hypothetical protein